MNLQPLARRLSRLTTDIVVRRPRLWFLLRGLTRFQFGRLAPQWDAIRAGDTAYAPYEAALERVDPPKRALDLGTGTGGAAFAIARRFAEAEVIGVDLAGQMIAQARGKLTDDLAGRVRFEVADAAHLPYDTTQHFVMNHMVKVNRDTANAMSYVDARLIRSIPNSGGRNFYEFGGWYDDEGCPEMCDRCRGVGVRCASEG